MSEHTPKHVFVSYVRENQEQVDRLCQDLKRYGVNVWLDRDKILPGLFWRDAIRKAIQEGAFFISVFSKEYNEKTSTHMNEEIILAIEALRKQPREQAWFIPVILSGNLPDWEIMPGRTLRDIQWVPLHENWEDGIQRILSVIGDRQPPKLRITAPNEINQSQEYVDLYGKGAIPGNGIILITSLHNLYLAPQEIHVIADSNGEWKYPGCHLFNPGKRYVYALSVKTENEEEVRRFLKEKKGKKTEDAMLKFSDELNSKGIFYQLSEPIMLNRAG
jgi:hypothetical protein